MNSFNCPLDSSQGDKKALVLSLDTYGTRPLTEALRYYFQFHLAAVRSDHRTERQARHCPSLRGPTRRR